MKGVAALLLIATGTNAIKVQSDPMFSSLGYETRHYKGEGDYDDYNVPNFGRDNEVITTLKNAADAEKKQGHFWDVMAPSPDDPPRNIIPKINMVIKGVHEIKSPVTNPVVVTIAIT